jgi:hypothetical protein
MAYEGPDLIWRALGWLSLEISVLRTGSLVGCGIFVLTLWSMASDAYMT